MGSMAVGAERVSLEIEYPGKTKLRLHLKTDLTMVSDRVMGTWRGWEEHFR